MSKLRICRICLRTEGKVYKFNLFQLKHFYEEIIAQKVNESDGLPQWFCFECAALLLKFHKFKEKCYEGLKTLKELIREGPITYENVNNIDRTMKGLESSLGKITNTERVKTINLNPFEVEIKFDAKKYDELYQKVTFSLSCARDSVMLDTANVKNESNAENITDNDTNSTEENYDSNINKHHSSPISVKVVQNSTVNTVDTKNSTPKRNDSEVSKDYGIDFLSEGNWKKICLSEEEALKEFRAKAEDPKYLDAAYKCGECFKGFSKKNMLKRHMEAKHSKDLGPRECSFCHMRFKWNCHLRKHLQQHYTKYECLRCNIFFHLDTSAYLHEEYHSGAVKKCVHCDEEFRHMTTYYTHLRTHRSAHVCVLCGASFVSEAGLHQHKRRKHPLDQLDSQTSVEDLDTENINETYCSRCDIRFENRTAFEEHLFHSAMHSEVIKVEEKDDITPAKKILGKRLRAKITNQLRKRKTDLDIPVPICKRKKKLKRKHRKPSTCHQCGLHFETQAACMKHHLAEHPGTSFYAPNERHICELCGASLAPGSVTVHQNMHSREKVHNCGTCGRQFHSTVGLKRHLLTHTGEKPFACTLCDKRFTQSNSMKLHFRTFHLKEPYPKRTRKNKKDQPTQSEQEESYEEESDSQPEQPPEASTSRVDHVPSTDDVTGQVVEGTEEDDIHYLTLN